MAVSTEKVKEENLVSDKEKDIFGVGARYGNAEKGLLDIMNTPNLTGKDLTKIAKIYNSHFDGEISHCSLGMFGCTGLEEHGNYLVDLKLHCKDLSVRARTLTKEMLYTSITENEVEFISKAFKKRLRLFLGVGYNKKLKRCV